jgi:hypothetical protein
MSLQDRHTDALRDLIESAETRVLSRRVCAMSREGPQHRDNTTMGEDILNARWVMDNMDNGPASGPLNGTGSWVPQHRRGDVADDVRATHDITNAGIAVPQQALNCHHARLLQLCVSRIGRHRLGDELEALRLHRDSAILRRVD